MAKDKGIVPAGINEYSAKFPQNPELAPLNFLIGTWNVRMTHSSLPNPLDWQDTFTWLDNGFIVWHWQGKNEVPQATLIIGRNEQTSNNKFSILYYDSRGISRFEEMSFENGVWKFWRNGADFFQRMEYIVSESGRSMVGHGEISYDQGRTWQHDFAIEYSKVEIS
jgi:hypothetical protein